MFDYESIMAEAQRARDKSDLFYGLAKFFDEKSSTYWREIETLENRDDLTEQDENRLDTLYDFYEGYIRQSNINETEGDKEYTKYTLLTELASLYK